MGITAQGGPRPESPQIRVRSRSDLARQRRHLLDAVVEIPMIGADASLNVAVAGSLVLYRLAGFL